MNKNKNKIELMYRTFCKGILANVLQNSFLVFNVV